MVSSQRQLIFVILTFILLVTVSFAGKNDKKQDKHKTPVQNKPPNNHHQSHKNSTMSHGHKNHTSSHANHTAMNENNMFIQSEQQSNPSNVGWSLDKSQPQQHHNNPNGYVMQSHDNTHGTMNQHHPQQNTQLQQNPSEQQGSNFGGIALGAAGGLASGAIGGKFFKS